MSDKGYVHYLEILDLAEDAKPGEVRKSYKRKIKDLIMEIARTELTEDRRDRFFLEIAKLNAAFYISRDNALRGKYWEARQEIIALEAEWCAAARQQTEQADVLRRRYDGKLRDFLGRYVEEVMLEAGRDAECVEASHWDAAHQRHAFRILRRYRQGLYQEILERLPYYNVTEPHVDWDERHRAIAGLLTGETA